MNFCILSLGSNIGNSKAILNKAYFFISQVPTIKYQKKSQLYVADPIGMKSDNKFTNSVLSIETNNNPYQLLKILEKIEKRLGKRGKQKNEDRTIDIDIIFFNQQEFFSNELIIPHPQWQKRLFVLFPLLEIYPKIKIPKIDIFDVKEFIYKKFSKEDIGNFLNKQVFNEKNKNKKF